MQAIVICGMEMASMIGRMKNHYNETFERERVQEHVDEPCVDEVLVISDRSTYLRFTCCINIIILVYYIEFYL